MNLKQLLASVAADAPPASLSPALCALWHAERGDWEAAHALAQDIKTGDGSWVHAHLHREEGDLSNARYWYSQADVTESTASIAEERHAIMRALLAR
jgi:hypothetical protein